MSSLQQSWRKQQNRSALKQVVWGGKGRAGGEVWRNDPNNVCTYEYMNIEKIAVNLSSYLRW
jgi:hypothetical protein